MCFIHGNHSGRYICLQSNNINISGVTELYVCSLVKNLPVLPDTLQKLYIHRASLERFPELPASLRRLHVEICSAEISSLPNSLESFYVRNCCYKKLPELPPTLTQFTCAGCDSLTKLPALPPTLIEFNCVSCRLITQLPIFPPNLLIITCHNCMWLNLPSNINYSKNMAKLTKIIRFLRNRNFYHRTKRFRILFDAGLYTDVINHILRY